MKLFWNRNRLIKAEAFNLFFILQSGILMGLERIWNDEIVISKVREEIGNIGKMSIDKGNKVAVLAFTHKDKINRQMFTREYKRLKKSIFFKAGRSISFFSGVEMCRIIKSSKRPVLTVMLTDGWIEASGKGLSKFGRYATRRENKLLVFHLDRGNPYSGTLSHDVRFVEELKKIGAKVCTRRDLDALMRDMDIEVGRNYGVLKEEVFPFLVGKGEDQVEKGNHLLDTAFEFVMNMTNAQSGSIMVVDRKTGDMHITIAKGLGKDIISAARGKVGEGIAGLVAKESNPVLIGAGHPLDNRIKPYLQRPQITSSIVAPIRSKINNEVYGVISVNTYEAVERFTHKQMKMLQEVADLAGATISASKN